MIATRVDSGIRQSAYDWIASRAHIARDLQDNDVHIAFVDEESNEIQGCLLFSDYDGHNIFVHLAIDNPRVCTKTNIRLMFDYAFNQAGCHRLSAICVNGYERNEKLLAGVGFVKEGVVRQAMKVNGKWIDAALYGILKGECLWV
jgi:RimJ/RimL family protein N-acetyltransferase